ncbi:Fc receptor-like protein 5 [Mustelus asterias]
METGALLLLFAAFAVQGRFSQWDLPKPQISLDRPTGVYLETENVTLTCTVETHCSDKTFYIYKDHQDPNIHLDSTRDNSARFSFAALNQGGRYQCYYWCQSDQSPSPWSESVTVTIAGDMPKPQISLDQPTGVYLETENVILTCNVETHCSGKTFSIYKNDQPSNLPPVSTRDNSARFSFTALNQRGRYQCVYRCQSDQSSSPLSESVRVTIAEQLRKPRISLSEPTGVYVVGETVTITCTAFGDNRDKTFHFYKGVQRLTSSGIDTKDNIGTFRNTGRSSEGPYQCQYEISIRNRQLISPMSESVTVTTADPLTAPVVSLDQQSGVYIVGEKVTITCTVTGDYHYRNFYFYKDNNPLHSSPISTRDKSVTYTATGVNIRGDYKCRYGYSIKGRWLESEFSNVVTPTFADPLTAPVVSLDQQSGVYIVGEKVTITCTVTGDYRDRTFYFYKDNNPLHSSPISTRDKSGTYTVTGVNIRGDYKCRYGYSIKGRWLESKFSNVVTPTLADPLTAPVVSLDQQSGVYIVGEKVTITCTVTGDYRDRNFYFYKDNNPLHSSPISTRDKSVTYTVTGVNIRVDYKCRYGYSIKGRRLESEFSNVVTPTLADPLTAPVVSLDQQSGVYIVGEKVTITCTVTGDYRDRTFYFYKDNNPLHSRLIRTGDRSVTDTVTSLNIRVDYKCRYGYSIKGRRLESAFSNVVTPTIADPLTAPVVSLDQQSGVYIVGEKVTITCTVTGDHRDRTFYFYKDNNPLHSRLISTRDKSVTYTVTGINIRVDYKCRYGYSIKGRRLESEFSNVVTPTLADPLTAPVVSLDQQSGVYIVGEKVTITCTVTGDYRYRNFSFYKDNNPRHSSRISTRDKSVTDTVTGVNIRVDYKCRYGYSIKGRRLESEFSNVVTPTIAILNKPHFWVDSDAAAQGGDVTFNCSSPRDNPAIAFYLYRQGEMELVSVKSPAADTHSVTFTVKNIDHSGIENYACRYEADVNGRNLTSGDSDPVNITVRENSSVASLVAGIGSAVGLILILALLGLCLWRKGKRGGSSEPRDTVPSVDCSSETLTYAVLNLQTKEKRDKGQRRRDIAQVEENTLYAEVKL